MCLLIKHSLPQGLRNKSWGTVQPEPELWPERRYMWGTSEAFNEKHSDLLLLRRLLLQEGVEEIADSKIERCDPQLL